MIQALAPAEAIDDCTGISELPSEVVRELVSLAASIKRRGRLGSERPLAGRSVAMLFEKPSLRTRTTFEVGIHQLGGQAIYLGRDEVKLGVREPVADVARNLERWVDMIVVRTFAHATVLELAEYASVPVINALSDHEHPCQALADMLTLEEQLGGLRGATLAYVGDGNNVAHSLLHAGAALGLNVRIATPPGYEPDREVVAAATRRALGTGSTIRVTNDPAEAVAGAQAVYTDVWTSMGSEAESARRLVTFDGYRVDEALMALAAPGALFMHCLPAHRGEEVSAAVIDGRASVVFDQAENRLHAQKALMTLLMQH